MVYLKEYELLEKREDLRTARLMTLIANINRGKNRRPFKVKDFMPQEQKKKMSRDEMVNVARAIAGAYSKPLNK